MFKGIKRAGQLGNAVIKVATFSKEHGPVVLFFFKTEAGYELKMMAKNLEQGVALTAAEVNELTDSGKNYLPIVSFLMQCYKLSFRQATSFRRLLDEHATTKAPIGYYIVFYSDGAYEIKDAN